LLTICVVWGMWLRYIPFAAVISKKQKRRLFWAYLICSLVNLGMIVAGMASYGIAFATNYLRYGGIIYSAFMMVINILLIPGYIREHLFVFGIVLNCQYILLYIPNYIITFLGITTPMRGLMIVADIFSFLLMLTYYPIRVLLLKTIAPVLRTDMGKYWNKVCLFPVLFFCVRFVNLGGERSTGSLTQLITGIISGVIIVFVCLSISNTQREFIEKLEMGHQLETQKVHYAELQTSISDARKQRHDMKHHITAIRHYMDIDDKEGLRRYCDDLWKTNHLDKSNLPYTGNAGADGIFYEYIQLSKDAHIDFRYSGVIRNNGVADIDLCVLLGNALDNAYAACLTLEENRSINVICQSESELLTIVVRNSFDGKVDVKEEKVMSRKRENRIGVGLDSMKTICNRYGGSLETSWDENMFNVVIMLPLAQ